MASRERGAVAGSILARAFRPQVTSRRRPMHETPRLALLPRRICAASSGLHGTNTLRFSGSITALATPFNAAGGIDFDAWQRLLAQQFEGGTHAVVVAGSTGEAAALTDDEYDVLLRSAVEYFASRAGERRVP